MPPSLYGHLRLPPQYFAHSHSHDHINRLQPGAILLTSGNRTWRVPVQQGGDFTVYGLPFGSYVLQADYHDFLFPTVRLDVRPKSHGSEAVVRAISNDYPETALEGTGLQYENPIVIPALSVHAYYDPREHFSVMAILKNPMILMMVVSFGLMGLVKLFPEEEMKESQKMQKELGRKLMNLGASSKEEAKNRKIK